MAIALPYNASTGLFTPAAITQLYHASNKPENSNLFLDIINFDKMLEAIIKLGSKVIQNFVIYKGLENTINSYNICKDDAISRYKKVYKTDNYNIELIKPFLEAVKSIVYYSRLLPRFSFYPDGARAVFIIDQKEITIEYDFDDPETILLSKFIDDNLHVKETTIYNLNQSLGVFL